MGGSAAMSESFYRDIDGELFEYDLRPSPREKVYWETYKARPSDIKILTDVTAETAKRLRGEIAADINKELNND